MLVEVAAYKTLETGHADVDRVMPVDGLVVRAINQAGGAAITYRVVNKCRVSIKKAITPIGKVNPSQPIHTTGQKVIGGRKTIGIEDGMQPKSRTTMISCTSSFLLCQFSLEVKI